MSRNEREAALALGQTLRDRAEVYRGVGADHPDRLLFAEAANTIVACVNALDAQEAAAEVTHQQLAAARESVAEVARLEHELAALTSTAPGAP